MFDTFCACGRRVEDCDGSRAGCPPWPAASSTAPLDVRGVTPTVPMTSIATNVAHPGPMVVWVGEPAFVDRDQIRVDLRARLKRERNARDRQALARRGRGRG